MQTMTKKELMEINGGEENVDYLKWATITALSIALGAPFTPAVAGASLVLALWSLPVDHDTKKTPPGDTAEADHGKMVN